MFWLDVIIYILLLGAVIDGLRRGAAVQLLRLVAGFVAFTQAWRIAPWIRDHVLPWLDIEAGWLSGIAIAVLAFVIVYSLLYYLGRMVISILNIGIIALANRIAGALLGLVLGIYILGYFFTIVDSVISYAPEKPNDVRIKSQLYTPIKDATADFDDIYRYLSGL